MKSNDHLAYRTSLNYPLQISSPDSVNAHVNDEMRLIVMDQFDWPKLRGRDFVEKKYTVLEEGVVGDLQVQSIRMKDNAGGYAGKLVNGKYFFTEDVLNYAPPLELMFANFKENGMRPMVTRSWSWDFCGSWAQLFKLVADGEGPVVQNREWYFPFEDPELLGIECLADLLAYSYKFKWDRQREIWTPILDAHEVTMRIRKPWLAHLTQVEFGEAPNTTADDHTLLSFLVQKTASLLSDEEKTAVESFMRNKVTVDDLTRLNDRNRILVALLEAYRSPQLINKGDDVRETDPIFAFLKNLHSSTPDARYQ